MRRPFGIATRASIRYLARHPLLTVLSVLGIALGVAVVVSIDLANESAQRSFELSAARVAGRATHQIVASESVDGDLYRWLRVDAGVRRSAPIVDGYALSDGRTFQILGIDPFADRAFRPYTANLSGLDLGAFMGGDVLVLVPPTLNAESGDTLRLSVGGRAYAATVGGVLVPEDAMSREATANLIVMDIGSAQRIFGLNGRISRIDLILESDSSAARIERLLPAGVRLVRSSSRTETVDQMTAAFELNLNALSLLALVVAMFLIYNTMTFSVIQRRTLLGRLRAIGMTRRQIFEHVLFEAFVLGAVGSVLGLIMGIILAQGLVHLVTQTINDLYYVLEVRSVSLEPTVLLKAAGLGIAATVAAAWVPAREAASAPVHVVLKRSEEERRTRSRLSTLSSAGVACAACAVGVLTFSRSLTLSYAGLFLILAAFALLAPAATLWIARGARMLLGKPFGLIGRMAAQGIVQRLSRTSVAVAALSIAVAAAVGVGVMVGSFRDTVDDWLAYTLQADLYVQPPSSVFRVGQGVLEEDVVARLSDVEGVRAISSVRRIDLTLDSGLIHLAAIDPGPGRDQAYRYTDGSATTIWERFRAGGHVLVSEPLAYRMGLAAGDTLELPTDRGGVAMPVAGVYYDYGSEQGAVLMNRTAFTQYFDAHGLSGISIYATAGSDLSALADRIRQVMDQDVIVRSNQALREASLEVFDRSFAITTVLRILALLVAFVGVVSALMALQIERAREMAVLRAEGMTPALVGAYLTLQSGVIGTIAGLLAIPLGTILAYVLIFVINKRSFGWTLQFSVPVEILLQALGLAVAAALMAGVYPSISATRRNTAEALRLE